MISPSWDRDLTQSVVLYSHVCTCALWVRAFSCATVVNINSGESAQVVFTLIILSGFAGMAKRRAESAIALDDDQRKRLRQVMSKMLKGGSPS